MEPAPAHTSETRQIALLQKELAAYDTALTDMTTAAAVERRRSQVLLNLLLGHLEAVAYELPPVKRGGAISHAMDDLTQTLGLVPARIVARALKARDRHAQAGRN